MKIEDHIGITDYAVDLYWMFSTTELAENFKKNIKEILEGARSAGNRIIQSRSRNLHFYNNGNRLKPKKVKLLGAIPLYTLYPTSEYYLQDCIDELDREMLNGISKNTYVLIGKILHLVQDMSSPAHVVPVYHSFRSGDSFESRLNSRMSLYMSNYTLSQDGFNRICCNDINLMNNKCIEMIYKDAASQTIDRICTSKSSIEVKVNGKPAKVGWDLFWKNHEETNSRFGYSKGTRIDGFGRYGPLGKHFGQERVTVLKNKYEIHKNVYDGLCHFVVKKSIEDSLRVLSCIGRRVEEISRSA